MREVPQILCDHGVCSASVTLSGMRHGARHRAIGIERNESYCEVAANRLSQEAMPLDVEIAKGRLSQPIQGGML